MSDLRYNAEVPVLPDVLYWHKEYRTSVLRYFYNGIRFQYGWSMLSIPVSSAFVQFLAGRFVQFLDVLLLRVLKMALNVMSLFVQFLAGQIQSSGISQL